MAGFNGMEGGLSWAVGVAPQLPSFGANGISLGVVSTLLQSFCQSRISSLSTSTCVDFIIENYQLNKTTDDKDRARKYMDFLGNLLYLCTIYF